VGAAADPCVWDGCANPRLARSVYCAAHERAMALRTPLPNDHNCHGALLKRQRLQGLFPPGARPVDTRG
jgi:hypothetical protein